MFKIIIYFDITRIALEAGSSFLTAIKLQKLLPNIFGAKNYG